MPHRARFFLFLTIAVICLLASAMLTVQQYGRFKAARGLYPPGSTIAGVPVGGLDAQAAGTRIAQLYLLTPVELRYQGAAVQIDPADAGASIDLAGMLSAQSLKPLLPAFIDYLWNRQPAGEQVHLACSVDGPTLRSFLSEQILTRYGTPGASPAAVPGDVIFTQGQPGEGVALDNALPSISAALCSPTDRVVELGSMRTEPAKPNPVQLQYALEALVKGSGFDGVIELYYQGLASGSEISFAYANGQPVSADIAFTAASTIKIPVMVSAYRSIEGDPPADLLREMELMIDLSDNASTDAVMENAIGENTAPIQVTEDMQALGLSNTFLAGFFYQGAPLLNRYNTPANQRTDLSTDPDIYNQTTPADMGRLLAGIWQCSSGGSGPLVEAYSGKVTQAECQAMVNLLSRNRKGVLIEAGLPDGARFAHKYGWVTDSVDGLMHAASDAAIVFSPGGDFVLTAYLYHPEQLHWDSAQRLIARLATAANNFSMLQAQ